MVSRPIEDDNPELALARKCIEYTGTNLFLTGKAGTGKTTFLQQLKATSHKRMVVLAPTGVAAINAGGTTIHSFFQLSFAPYVPGSEALFFKDIRFTKTKIALIKSLNLIVIDEISMVRADLLDLIDLVLRRYRDRNKPFGGIQLLMIGDLQQLAPVAKNEERQLLEKHYSSLFFFGSKALQKTPYITIELQHIYRQKEAYFVDLLNRIRNQQTDVETLKMLNERYLPDFNPNKHKNIIQLTTHNAQAHQINQACLDAIRKRAYTFEATIQGNFPDSSLPTDKCLTLKKGAQVMFVKNDSSSEKRYYNGKIGSITKINKDTIEVKCQGEGEKAFVVDPVTWENTKYELDIQTKEIHETVEGTFKQYPLRLAWAITIHKSQGLTFDNVVIDAAAAFAHGQVYVALSRCRTLDGLILSSPIQAHAIISNATVEQFTRQMKEHPVDQQQIAHLEREYYYELLNEQFDFQLLTKSTKNLTDYFAKHLQQAFPMLLEKLQNTCQSLQALVPICEQFKKQYTYLFRHTDDAKNDQTLQERIHAASKYFSVEIKKIFEQLRQQLKHVEIDNMDTASHFEDLFNRLLDDYHIKKATLEEFQYQPFDIKVYLDTKGRAVIKEEDLEKSYSPRPLSADEAKTFFATHFISSHDEDFDLYNHLLQWRKAKAKELKIPPYSILRQESLVNIAKNKPRREKDLLSIAGIGKKTLEKYGNEILEIVAEFCR